MGKYNIDKLLSELGVDGPSTPEPPAQEMQGARPDRWRSRTQADQARRYDEQQGPPDEQEIDLDAQMQAQMQAEMQAEMHAQMQGDIQVYQEDPDDAQDTGVASIYIPDEGASTASEQRLAAELVKAGAITQAQLTNAQKVLSKTPGLSLIETLIDQGADETPIQQVIARAAGLPFGRIDLEKGLDGGFDENLVQRLGVEFCKHHLVVPLRTEGSRVVIGATRTDDVFLLDEIRHRLRVAGIKLVIVTASDVRAALEIVSHDETDNEQINAILAEVDEGDVEIEKSSEDEVDLEREAAESPIIRYVNYIIQHAVKEGASDIHIEPAEKKLKVRYRIDGVLFEAMNPPIKWAAAITSRLKIMANLDISERRLPQDGRIRCVVQGRKLDLRMSTLPNAHGEKTVMRILDTRSINVQLEDLGFDAATLEIWQNQIKAPHGIVLVTGPTGSGKTTTLYASLRQLDKSKLNISTVEDPIEYHLDGITQTQMHEKIGMGFARALKALLRQDPDVIMLGEIRDTETATIAIQAALTGHLVLSTLHTNDAPASITRLINIGIEPFLVGAAVNGVLAQRLVRRLCQHCKKQQKPTEEMAEFLEMQGIAPDKAWTAEGCDRCRSTGYSGRVGLYEQLTIDDQVRDIVARNPNVAEFRRLCIERGMVSLRADGMRKVSEGLTSVQEVLRVTEATV
jgi:type IV pilus assembly protein PilB